MAGCRRRGVKPTSSQHISSVLFHISQSQLLLSSSSSSSSSSQPPPPSHTPILVPTPDLHAPSSLPSSPLSINPSQFPRGGEAGQIYSFRNTPVFIHAELKSTPSSLPACLGFVNLLKKRKEKKKKKKKEKRGYRHPALFYLPAFDLKPALV
ncbi:hypothetical protein H072_3223 [Dactylellina haptotyla CBS 200.50]|uniref:Uncharacterized protein n=1 Tax=Dactylellina haptotyla (strain CBS 200.50) TaxID=1284197 RepID=S8C4Y8_DACHA|nr:hypothetical protein H072_3223 [Dactylellina haptotyla CBS 200.50]